MGTFGLIDVFTLPMRKNMQTVQKADPYYASNSVALAEAKQQRFSRCNLFNLDIQKDLFDVRAALVVLIRTCE